MSPTKFICEADQLIEGVFVELQAETDQGTRFLIGSRHQGEARIWVNCCPHQGRPLNWAPNRFLKDEKGHLVCAAHGAVFETDEGRCLSGPCRNAALTSVAVREEDGQILIAAAN